MPRERTWHSFWHSVELPWDFSYCQVTQTVLGSDPLSAFQEHLQWWCCCLQHSDPDRITMSENSAFKRFIQVCARIQHLQGLPLCLAIRTYSRWKEKKKKKRQNVSVGHISVENSSPTLVIHILPGQFPMSWGSKVANCCVLFHGGTRTIVEAQPMYPRGFNPLWWRFNPQWLRFSPLWWRFNPQWWRFYPLWWRFNTSAVSQEPGKSA